MPMTPEQIARCKKILKRAVEKAGKMYDAHRKDSERYTQQIFYANEQQTLVFALEQVMRMCLLCNVDLKRGLPEEFNWMLTRNDHPLFYVFGGGYTGDQLYPFPTELVSEMTSAIKLLNTIRNEKLIHAHDNKFVSKQSSYLQAERSNHYWKTWNESTQTLDSKDSFHWLAKNIDSELKKVRKCLNSLPYYDLGHRTLGDSIQRLEPLTTHIDGIIDQLNQGLLDAKEFKSQCEKAIASDGAFIKKLKAPHYILEHLYQAIVSVIRAFFRVFDVFLGLGSARMEKSKKTPFAQACVGRDQFFPKPETIMSKHVDEVVKEFHQAIEQWDELLPPSSSGLSLG